MVVVIDIFGDYSNMVYQVVGEKAQVNLVSHNELSTDKIRKLNPSHIILSVGYSPFADYNLVKDIIDEFKEKCPILGIGEGCLRIGEIYRADIMQVKTETVNRSQAHIANGNKIFEGFAPITQVIHYPHRFINRSTLPEELQIIGEDSEQRILAIKHKDYQIYGLLFHPESILIPENKKILHNFVKIEAGE